MKARYEPIRGKDGIIVDQIISGGHQKPLGKAQNIHTQSTVQNYDIGTRLVLDDRVFRYCKAGTLGLRAMLEGLDIQDSIKVYTHATISAAGTYEVTILDTIARDKDHYKGGYLWIEVKPPEPTGIGQHYRVKSSEASEGVSIKITLWEPLTYEVPASAWIEILKSIYCDLRRGINDFASLVALPLIPVDAGSYFWGQTWGPVFMQCGYNPGDKNDDREVYYKSDHYGILPGSEIDFTADFIPQRIGFLLNSNFVMLQLAP